DRCLVSISDGLDHLRYDPQVNSQRIGIVGMSLGSFTGLLVASEPRNKVSAVVSISGGLPACKKQCATALPPTLILHGDADPMVPVQMAKDLYSALPQPQCERGIHELHIYKGGGHMFMDARTGKIQLLYAFDAQTRGASFLKKHLHEKVVQERSE